MYTGINFEKLLEKDKVVKIHVRNLQVLVTEMFKVKNNIAPKITSDILNFPVLPITWEIESFCFTPSENSVLWYWVTILPGSKIMGSFNWGLENITSLTQFKPQVTKMGFAKLALPNLKGMHPEL